MDDRGFCANRRAAMEPSTAALFVFSFLVLIGLQAPVQILGIPVLL